MVKEKLSSHATELIGLEEPFQLVFSEISEQLAEFENLLMALIMKAQIKLLKELIKLLQHWMKLSKTFLSITLF